MDINVPSPALVFMENVISQTVCALVSLVTVVTSVIGLVLLVTLETIVARNVCVGTEASAIIRLGSVNAQQVGPVKHVTSRAVLSLLFLDFLG